MRARLPLRRVYLHHHLMGPILRTRLLPKMTVKANLPIILNILITTRRRKHTPSKTDHQTYGEKTMTVYTTFHKTPLTMWTMVNPIVGALQVCQGWP